MNRQYRIRVTEYEDGHCIYRPQYKDFIFWRAFREHYYCASGTYPVKYNTRKEAEECINADRKKWAEILVKSVSYLNFEEDPKPKEKIKLSK